MEIIAEIGQNYNGDMGLAKEMIKTAKASGADVAKFQVFETDSIFQKQDNPWYDYNCRSQLTRDEVFFLAEECEKNKIEFCASVFDAERVEWLETVNVKRYKIASRSVKDQPLISALVETNKPLIVSLGMWDSDTFPSFGDDTVVDYLYCISKYPTQLEDLNFSNVDFSQYSGFSDHTIGITASIVALARGAKIIEKHFTLDKTMYGPDHQGSMTPEELKSLSGFRDRIQSCL